MRHLVNFGLLFCFAALAVTGAMAFWLPFSITTTRVHIVFGLLTATLVVLHLLSRGAYFRGQLTLAGRPSSLQNRTAALLLVLGGVLVATIAGWSLTRWFVAQGYEARHRAEIVRSSPLAGFVDEVTHRRIVGRVAGDAADVSLSLTIGFQKGLQVLPAVAVWAESTTGAMIETLYLDEALAYAETPSWGGQPTARNEILPIWRHRYTMVSGVDPQGAVDVVTAATPTHSFTLDDYLTLGEAKEFVLCVEVNAPRDPNDNYPDAQLGQPSLLYTAYIEVDSPQAYSLLELTGHGGGAQQGGDIHYDLDGVTSAKRLIDLLLVKTSTVNKVADE